MPYIAHYDLEGDRIKALRIYMPVDTVLRQIQSYRFWRRLLAVGASVAQTCGGGEIEDVPDLVELRAVRG